MTQRVPLYLLALVLGLQEVLEALSGSLLPQLLPFLIRYYLVIVPSHSSPVTRVNLWLAAISIYYPIMCTFTIYIHFQQTNFPSLDPQSHPYLPQLHFLAGGETPWTETQTLRSLPPWATTTSRSRVNKELVDGEDSPATELWARLRAWSDWPAPQDPSPLHL